ncbi:MAG: hypothetical protein NT002_00100 [candidate division Zixibacteria bacterium]|nr:hypothetical protein [candidate division Zixibacteria bacterium]
MLGHSSCLCRLNCYKEFCFISITFIILPLTHFSNAQETGSEADIERPIAAVFGDLVVMLNNPLLGRFDDTVYGVDGNILRPQPKREEMIIKTL